MLQLETVLKTDADSPVDLMAMLPAVTNSGSRGTAMFVVDMTGAVDAYVATSEDATTGARLTAPESYECGPYDWPGARLWLHLPAGATARITPFRSGVRP